MRQRSINSSVNFIVLCTMLFVLGIGYPGSAPVIVSFFLLYVFYRVVVRKTRIGTAVAIDAGLLMLFGMSYFGISYLHGYYTFADSMSYIIGMVGMYLVGYLIEYKSIGNWQYSAILIVLAYVAGGILFVFLSVRAGLGIGEIELVRRTAPNVWQPSAEPVNGPALDLFSMLGVTLLPSLLLFKRPAPLIWRLILSAMVVCLFILALYATVVLQGRKNIFALIIVLVCVYLYKIIRIDRTVLLRSLALVATGGLVAMYLLTTYFDMLMYDYSVVARIEAAGFDTPRYEMWANVIAGLWMNLSGGREIVVGSYQTYAHNLWLDVAFDAGVVPLVALLLFHMRHIRPIYRVLVFREFSALLHGVIICLILGFVIGYMLEPVIQASRTYFAISCFFLGFIRKLARYERNAV